MGRSQCLRCPPERSIGWSSEIRMRKCIEEEKGADADIVSDSGVETHTGVF
jgi:hypothetical protein